MFEISESSITAALQLSEDSSIDKKNKSSYQHYLNTYDYPNGKKMINFIGAEKFIELNKSEDKNRKRILREILMKILKKQKGPELFSLPMGINHFLEKFDDNFKQVLENCDLLTKFKNTEKSKEIRDWWREMATFARSVTDQNKIESGDQGEEKTFEFEVNKLKKLSIKKEPNWDSLYDELLGYDIQSWDKDINKIFIDSKASSNINGEFWFSKGEWLTAKREKNKYFVYLWIKDDLKPRIINFLELKKYINDYDIINEKNAFWPKLRIIPEGQN